MRWAHFSFTLFCDAAINFTLRRHIRTSYQRSLQGEKKVGKSKLSLIYWRHKVLLPSRLSLFLLDRVRKTEFLCNYAGCFPLHLISLLHGLFALLEAADTMIWSRQGSNTCLFSLGWVRNFASRKMMLEQSRIKLINVEAHNRKLHRGRTGKIAAAAVNNESFLGLSSMKCILIQHLTFMMLLLLYMDESCVK